MGRDRQHVFIKLINASVHAHPRIQICKMAVIVAPPENLQPQSALVQLPAEIKNLIYSLCFIAEAPIIDPGCTRERRNKTTSSPRGIPLLQTCRRNYHEVDRRPLFTQNTFRFTHLDTMRAFLHSLHVNDRMHVQDIEIDVRNLNSDHPHIGREWLSYMAWEKSANSLRMDAVGLKCLRLNFEAWPVIAMFRKDLWKFLRSMLSKLEGLDRIVVIGRSKGKTQKPPWSPVHFVGGDEVGANDLLFRMSRSVVGRPEDKTIRWLREDGKLQLEVVSRPYLLKCVGAQWSGPSRRLKHTDPWPINGSCTCSGYEDSHSDPQPKVIPTVVE
jgi:hypothetical protein